MVAGGFSHISLLHEASQRGAAQQPASSPAVSWWLEPRSVVGTASLAPGGQKPAAATMAGFTESALVKKLMELNPSQQSIQTLSLWLIHHRKHHATIVKVWFKELCKCECPLSPRASLALGAGAPGVAFFFPRGFRG